MKLLDLVFAARPMLHLPIWSVYLVALFYHGEPGDNRFGWSHLLILTALSLMASGAYYLNQVFDHESDRINRKLGFLQKNLLTKRELIVAGIAVSTAALISSLFHSPLVVVIFMQLILLSYAYSAPPLRLKDRPLAGLLANAYSFGILVPFTLVSEWSLSELWRFGHQDVLYFFLAVAAIHLLTTLPDRTGDKAVGKRTTAVILSPVTVKLLALLLTALAGLAALAAGRYALLGLAVVSILPLPVTLLVRSSRWELFAAKLPVLLLTLLAGYAYPGYLLFIVVLLVSCRIYYRKRFNMVYPKLT